MLATILNAFQVADIRKKIAFTAVMLLIYRFGSHVPVPGVNLTAVNNIQKEFGGSNILGLLNLFSGGGLSKLAIFALGIMPYITASIILQLLQVVVPSLEKLSKEGEVGQARITQYTRYLTVGLAFAQSIGYVFLFHTLQAKAGESVVAQLRRAPHLPDRRVPDRRLRDADVDRRAHHPTGDRQRHLPADLRLDRGAPAERHPGLVDDHNQVFKVMMPFLVLAVVAGIVFVQEGQRRIPVQYAKRVIGRRMSEGGQTYLPLRVNMAGVIPVIFAASLMAFPADRRSARENPLGRARVGLLHPQRVALRARRVDPDHRLHLLLHGGHL